MTERIITIQVRMKEARTVFDPQFLAVRKALTSVEDVLEVHLVAEARVPDSPKMPKVGPDFY